MRTIVGITKTDVGRITIKLIVAILVIMCIVISTILLLEREAINMQEKIQNDLIDQNSVIENSMTSIQKIIFLMAIEFIVILLLTIILWFVGFQKSEKHLKIMLRELRIRDETFQILATQSARIVIRKDLLNGTFEVLNEEAIERSSIIKKIHSNPKHIWTLIHPEDIENEVKAVEIIKSGQNEEMHMSRLRINSDDYLWHKIIQVGIKDDEGTLTHILCVVQDVHADYVNTARLKEKAERDSATGLLNQITTAFLITEELHQEQVKGAMLILDIDNFKGVNDKFGHPMGDTILELLSNTLITIFNKSDIIGRLGGDEFIVYMKNTDDIAVVEKKVKELQRVLNNLHNSGFPDITVSIGVTFAEFGKEFTDLYKEADDALYEMKKEGKNGYIVFRDPT